MTVLGADFSNFNTTTPFAGLGFMSHKATEGTKVKHDKYGARLNAARAATVPVLGSYHVVRTPGNDGNGSLDQQLAYWVAYLDAQTPWWRTYPNWLHQIDAEKWEYDAVSATTVKQFAALLVSSGLPGYKVTYASRGQYGDGLAGIVTDLWNADYRGGPSYPGDGWVRVGSSPAGWAPYSGKATGPKFLQYTSTPYDKDAFRGSLEQLLALTRSTPAPAEAPPARKEEVTMFMAKTATNDAVRLSDGFKWKWLKPDPFNVLRHDIPLYTVPDSAALDALCGVEDTETNALTPDDVIKVAGAAQLGAKAAFDGATVSGTIRSAS